MTTDYQILFLSGGGAFSLCVVGAALFSYFWLWRGRFSTFILTAIQCAILALAYWLMAFDWFFKQRKDGREFPWYRDVALLLVMFLQTWIVSVVLWLDKVDAFAVLGATFVGSAALTIANFMTADEYWFGWAMGGIAIYGGVQAWIFASSKRRGYASWIVYGASFILIVCLPLAQLLSWTMLQVLDKSPRRWDSELAYLIVSFVGVVVMGLAAGLLQHDEPWVLQRIEVPPVKAGTTTTQDTEAELFLGSAVVAADEGMRQRGTRQRV